MPPLLEIDRPVILASASPRRATLLSQIGLRFTVHPAEIDEDNLAPPDLAPEDLATHLSAKKADAVAPAYSTGLIIAADTVVSMHDHLLGKPADEEEAFGALKMLSGAEHEVITGVTLLLLPEQRRRTFSVRTIVRFRSLSDPEIRTYIATGEPADKAGGYGIQGKGAVLVDSIDGDYNNVVGFPLTAFYVETLQLLNT